MPKIYDMSDTWDNGATQYSAIKMNVTDSASASGSALIDLQVGETSKFKVDKDGNISSPTITTLQNSIGVDVERTIIISATPEDTDLEVANGTFSFQMPFAMNITEIRAFVGDAPTGANAVMTLVIDGSNAKTITITANSQSVKYTGEDIDAADEDIVTLNITQVGSSNPGSGLKITLKGTEA